MFDVNEDDEVTKTKKTILFWNSYWHWGHFKMGVGNRGFSQCSFSNCYTTTMKSKLLKNPRVIVNAVIFHGVGLNKEEVKGIKKIRKMLPEKNQGVDPLFILFMLVIIFDNLATLKSCMVFLNCLIIVIIITGVSKRFRFTRSNF